jgi:hypothetical protein
MDHTEALPDDVLASILRRLRPCDIAASRCVRKSWRAVDAHGLLLPNLVQGIFINYVDYERHTASHAPRRSSLRSMAT